MFPSSSHDVPEYYRVDAPYLPNALATSAYGSIVESPPHNMPYRPVFWATIDETLDERLDNIVIPEDLHVALNSRIWHDQDYSGADVKIAIFDVEWQGADWANGEMGPVTTHDCFAHPSCEIPIDSAHPRFGFERGVHGIACTEIIHDLAPAAELHLVRVLGLTSLENAVDWAIREEIDYISMSLSFFNESFYDGTGPINDLMDKLRTNDVVMVTSAGNYARGHHRTTFEDVDRDGQHDFDDVRGLPIYFTKGRRNVQIVWNDFQQCGWNDVNVYLWSRSGELIGKSLRQQTPYADSCHPSESIVVDVETDGWTFLTLENIGYGRPKIDIMARGGYVYNTQRAGSIVDPGMHPSVLTVGAVRVDNYLFNDVESFSSAGPNTDVQDGVLVQKPEVLGPNGIDTISYGSKGFFGTSASTPATVGVLALYKEAHPELTNYQTMQKLIEHSIELTEYQSVNSTYGKIRLPNPPNTHETSCSGSFALLFGLCIWRFCKAPLFRMGYNRTHPLRHKG